MLKIHKMILTAILFFLLPHFSIQDETFYYERVKNIFCANIETGCSFDISSANPFSPKIPTNILKKIFLDSSNNFSIYFKLYMPKGYTINFSLMVYDSFNLKSIFSKGDYFNLGRSYSDEFVIQFSGDIKDITYIQFLFFGLPTNIQFQVDIKFKISYIMYMFSYTLDETKILKLIDNEKMLNYIKNFYLLYNKAIERANTLKTIITDIMKQTFDITISFQHEILSNTQIIFIPPCLMATVSYAVSLETSASRFFEPERFILSETEIGRGKINYHQDGFELFKNSQKNEDLTTLKSIESFNKKLKNIFFEWKLPDNEFFSITLSTDSFVNNFVITLCHSADFKFLEIDGSIEIKIEFINQLLGEKSKSTQMQKATEKSFSGNEESLIIITGIIAILGIIAIISTGGVASGAAAVIALPLA